MEISRRDFMHIAAIFGLGAIGAGCTSPKTPAQISLKDIYDFKAKGNVTLLHMCDLHAHIKPLYWREPSTLISAPNLVGTPGFLCGEAFAKHYGLEPSSLDAYFDTYMDFETLARKFGKMGGIAHMKTLLDHVRKERGNENVLFLDSGDTWQGTGVALKTGGEAIVKAQNYLGVDVMVGHWEFTYGKERVKELIEMLNAKFVSQNIVGNDPFADEYEELIFEPYTIEERGGAKIGIIGQSFPFTSTANPKEFTEGWSFGLRLETLQEYVNELRNEHKVDCVVVLSHDGFSVDQEVARQVHGIDFILSGHTHDPSPKPITIDGTVIVIAGSHGKYVGRLDIDVKDGKVNGYEYKLIPIASNMIPADPEGVKLVNELYAPFDKEFNEVLGQTKNMLYKRDTFFSTFDQLINDAIMDEMKCDISFTPGYRWGTTVLAGDDILMDNVYEMCGITYPNVYTFELQGKQIATLLEDIADNVFNSNPLYQQGGDMSRLGGVTYDIAVANKAGHRISNLKVGGKPIDLDKTYIVSSWGGNLQNAGKNLQKDKIRPVYDIVRDYINSSLAMARLTLKNGPLKAQIAYSAVADAADIVAPWRGFPTGGYTRAMAQYNWYANTKTMAAEVAYDFGKAKMIHGLRAMLRYAMQDFDESKQAAGVQADSNVIHIDFRERITKALDAKVRIGLVSADKRVGSTDKDSYNEYRFELNYLF